MLFLKRLSDAFDEEGKRDIAHHVSTGPTMSALESHRNRLVKYGQNDQRRPLSDQDTLDQTLGCRLSKPEFCKNHSTLNKCAFVRDDNLCLLPPNSWKKIYLQLREEQHRTALDH